MLIDTHAHLWWQNCNLGDSDILYVVPGVDVKSSQQAISMAKKNKSKIFAAVGIHPEEVLKTDTEKELAGLREIIKSERKSIVAIGEIGVDFNTEELVNYEEEQIKLFTTQMKIAHDYDLPVIIHTRKSLDKTLELIDKLPFATKGVFHAFSHDLTGMQEVVKRGFLVGIGGSVSYSRRIQKLVKEIPEDKLILETDWPFLPSGLTSDPESVKMLAQIVSFWKEEPLSKLEETTTRNAKELFGI